MPDIDTSSSESTSGFDRKRFGTEDLLSEEQMETLRNVGEYIRENWMMIAGVSAALGVGTFLLRGRLPMIGIAAKRKLARRAVGRKLVKVAALAGVVKARRKTKARRGAAKLLGAARIARTGRVARAARVARVARAAKAARSARSASHSSPTHH